MWRRALYIAEDPESSANYRTIGVLFTLRPDARTIPYSYDLWRTALREVGARHPGLLEACGDYFKGELTYGFNNILFFIAEDSLIDVVEYYERSWFQLISPRSIVRTSFLRR